jgi:hypothetical protein
MSQKDPKDQLDEKLSDEQLVEVSEEQLEEESAAASIDTKGDAKSAKFGQGADFKDDKEKSLGDLGATKTAEAPKTKSGIIAKTVEKLNSLKKEDLQVIYGKLFSEEAVVEEVKAEEKASIVSEAQVQEDLKALVDGDANLSEEFKEKTAVLFQAAITSRLAEEVEKLEDQYQSKLDEEVQGIRSELVEKIDGYLNYVVEQWMEENEVAIESGLRAEIAESFIDSLKTVFVEHYVEVPEGKADLVDGLASQVEELEEQLQSSTVQAVKLAEQVEELTREKIVREATEGMIATEADKLSGLVEGVEFEDATAFARKVSIVKEAHFIKSNTTSEILTEELEEQTEQQSASPRMTAYMAAISRTIKK